MKAYMARRAFAAAFAVIALAACAQQLDFDTAGLTPPPAQCPVDPKLVAEAWQLEPMDKGNGCQIPNPWRVSAVASVKLKTMSWFRNGVVVNCGVVGALNNWVEGVVQPAAKSTFGEPVQSVQTVGSFSCRPRNKTSGEKMSEHGFGNAIDLSEFTLTSGRKITVATGWNGSPEEQSFLRAIDKGACEHFTTVLSPQSGEEHEGHFHLDLAIRADGSKICE